MFLFVAVASADNAEFTSIQLVDYGIYSSDRDSPKLITQTERIPAEVGTVFGVRAKLPRNHSAVYRYKWTFPKMQNPENGQKWTEMVGSEELVGGESFPFFVRINRLWEAVPGEWTLRLMLEEQLVLEKVFQVYELPTKDD